MSSTEYIFGFHPIEALLEAAPHHLLELYVQQDRKDERLQKLLKKAVVHSISIVETNRKKLDGLSHHAQHQGIVAKVRKEVGYGEDDLENILQKATESALLLILDGVQDPHNLGACLRSANAAGVHAVIAPKDNSVGLTPVVRKVASGAAELTPFIQVTNLARTLRWLQEQGIWIYGTAGDAEQTLYTLDLTGPMALVLGAEGKGLRRLTREHCDGLISIPMLGQVESLNVSVATGVCLFETLRQRTTKQALIKKSK